jgi:hypothetical protein
MNSAMAENPSKTIEIPLKLSESLENFFADCSAVTRIKSSSYGSASARLPKLDVDGSNPFARSLLPKDLGRRTN